MYGPDLGLPELRAALRDKVARRNGLDEVCGEDWEEWGGLPRLSSKTSPGEQPLTGCQHAVVGCIIAARVQARGCVDPGDEQHRAAVATPGRDGAGRGSQQAGQRSRSRPPLPPLAA